MNNKVEIFKLALKAGTVELTEEQSKFVIDCFIKAEKLSGGAVKKDQPSSSNAHKGGPRNSSHEGFQGHSKSNGSKFGGPKSGGQKSSGPQNWTGRGLFIKEKMAELKTNGADYQKNKTSAHEAWDQLLDEEKEVFNTRASAM